MSQCDTCAFNAKGTGGAANEIVNRLKGLLCAHGGIPFFCHHIKSGEEYNWQAGGLGPFSVPIAQRKVCDGWRGMVGRLAKRGKFHAGETPQDRSFLLRYQRSLASDALNTMERYLAEKEPSSKAEIKRELDDLVRAVFDRDSLNSDKPERA